MSTLDEILKAATELEQVQKKDSLVDLIYDWKYVWMNQDQNSKEDHENYFRRALGVDANMVYSLAKMIEKSSQQAYLCDAIKHLVKRVQRAEIVLQAIEHDPDNDRRWVYSKDTLAANREAEEAFQKKWSGK